MKIVYILSFYFFWFSFMSVYGQNTASLALDPSIHYGQLDNGFTYYMKPLPVKGGKTSMRLLLQVGHNQEDSNQVDLAHYLEHMPFVETAHFSNILFNHQLLESLNMESVDISARTSWEKTLYWFNYPSGNQRALEHGLLFFQDILSGKINFEDKNVDGERQPFFGEYVYRGGKEVYARNLYRHRLFSDCFVQPIAPEKYENYIQSFPKEELIRFYEDWYRPDVAALVITGPIENVEALEKKIIGTFSTIPQKKNARSLRNCENSYLEQPPQFTRLPKSRGSSKHLDRETEIKLFFRLANRGIKRLSGLKEQLMQELRLELLNQSLAKALTTYSSSYKAYARFENNLPVIEVSLKAKQGLEEEGVVFVAGTFKALEKWGATQSEWLQLKENTLNRLKQVDTQQAAYWNTQIEHHFLNEEALPGKKSKLLMQLLVQTNLKEFNRFLNEVSWVPEDIAVLHPENAPKAITKVNLETWMSNASPLKPALEHKDHEQKLMTEEQLQKLKEKKVQIKPSSIPKVTEVVLQNGATVVLKNNGTLAKENAKINLHGFSPFGAVNFTEEDLYNALLVDGIVRNSGLKDMNKFELSSLLSNIGATLQVQPYVSYAESGIKAGAAAKDVETMLQLIYLYFTAARKDKQAFEDWLLKEQAAYVDPSYNISEVNFNDTIQKSLHDPTYRIMGKARYEATKKVDLDRAYEIYHTIFTDASRFTFVVTGNFNQKQLLPLITKYLGNLPSVKTKKKPEPKPEKLESVLSAPFQEIIYTPDPIDNVRIRWDYVIPYGENFSWKEQVKLEFLGLVIAMRLQDLRYIHKRGVFFATAGNLLNRDLRRNHLLLNVPTSKDDVHVVLEDIHRILEELKTKIEAGVFKDVGNSFIYPKYEKERLQENNQMLDRLYRYYRYGEPWVDAQTIDDYVRQLSPEDISQAARRYLKKEHRYLFLLKNKDDHSAD